MSNGILLEVNGESCTEGFMDYSLLQGKAATPSGPLRNNRLSENTPTRWMDSMRNDIMFTCATVITEILIGVDIRTVNDSIGRNLYPKFEVWAPTNDDDVYTREMSVEIRLTPDNFTTNGQYFFTLPTPLNVSSGYRIGVYQPPNGRSVVRFHYMNLPGAVDRIGKIQSNKIDDPNIKISGGGRDVDYESWTILLHPKAQDTNCYTQLLAPDNITLSSSITDLLFISNVTKVFPDIRFTCHGIITNWIIVANSLVTATVKTRNMNNLTTTALSVNISNAVGISSLLYNFTMSNEITVQPGDILMIESNATNFMSYQRDNGPHNYLLGDNNLITLDLHQNNYPLISVVIEPTSFHTATSTISSSTHINTVITVLQSSSIYSTATVTMESMEYTKTSLTTSIKSTVSSPAITSQNTGSINTIVLTENTFTVSTSVNSTVITTPVTRSLSSKPVLASSTATIENTLSVNASMNSTVSTPVPTSQSTGSNTLTILIAVLSTVFILLVVTILVILIVSVLVCRRIWNKTSNGNDTFSSDEMKNKLDQQSDVYIAPSIDEEQNILSASTNPAYGVTGGQEKFADDISANPAYGTSIGGVTEGVDVVYDEPVSITHNEQEYMTIDETHEQMKEEELYI